MYNGSATYNSFPMDPLDSEDEKLTVTVNRIEIKSRFLKWFSVLSMCLLVVSTISSLIWVAVIALKALSATKSTMVLASISFLILIICCVSLHMVCVATGRRGMFEKNGPGINITINISSNMFDKRK